VYILTSRIVFTITGEGLYVPGMLVSRNLTFILTIKAQLHNNVVNNINKR